MKLKILASVGLLTLGLVACGQDVLARDEGGRTSLMWEVSWNHNPEDITALLEAGAEVNARDEDGETPLTWALWSNPNLEVITVLLKAGANVKAKDSYGKTALDYAKENESIYKTKVYWELNDAFYK